MRSALFPTLLGLLAVVSAASTVQYGERSPTTTPSSTGTEFSLAMSVNGTYVAVTAVYNNTAHLVLQADLLSVLPGTPTYSNTTDTGTGSTYNTSLVFDLSHSTTFAPGAYGLAVPDLGELYGASSNVVAVRDYQEFEFGIDDGTVFHALTSASQSWFACLDSGVNGAQGYFLKWGVFTEGGAPPVGCGVTSVVQDYNL